MVFGRSDYQYFCVHELFGIYPNTSYRLFLVRNQYQRENRQDIDFVKKCEGQLT